MQVRHRSLAPVLIIGHGSSGTSILSRLLREYLRVSFGTESQFIVHYYRRLGRYGDLADDENLRRLIEHITGERWFRRCRKFGFRADAEAIFRDVTTRTYRGVLDAVFMSLAKHQGMDRWGDKTPEYNHDLDIIGELLPDAKYIHMVRDGRDVAESVFARYWGDKNVFMAAKEWKLEVSSVDAFAETLPAGQIVEITYEGLLQRPVATFARLIEFLEIDDPDGSLMDRVSQELPSELNRANYDKWRKRWTDRQRIAYEKIACDVLTRHGYDTVVDEVAAESGPLESLYWYCDNKVRKWTYWRYWKDNGYKMRLRATDVLRSVRTLLRPGRWSGTCREP